MLLHKAAILLAVCFLACSAQAANITVDTKITPGPTAKSPALVNNTVRYTGVVERGDAAKLRSILKDVQKPALGRPATVQTTLEMSSEGGDLLEGMDIGYLLREFEVATIVRRGDVCLSSCALAFLGGSNQDSRQGYALSRLIEIGAEVGFHNFALNPNAIANPGSNDPAVSRVRGFNEARGGASKLFRYGLVMGIDPTVLARIVGQPPEIFSYIDTTQNFLGFAVCPAQLPRPTISLAEQATNICNNATGSFEPVSPDQATPIERPTAQRLLLEQVQKSLLQSRSSGALSAQLASYAVMRDDGAKAKLYADLRAAGLPLPEMAGPVYRVGGYQAGAYEAECVVSFSLEDPDRYDAVIVGPGGLSAPARAAPQSCRRLFLYPIDYTINPGRGPQAKDLPPPAPGQFTNQGGTK